MNTLNCLFAQDAFRNAFSSKNWVAFFALTIFIFSVSSGLTSAQTFVNSAAITIADNGPAIPAYPSTINVTGTSGRITKVVVTLNGFTHGLPDDVGVLLVSPTGQKVRLLRRPYPPCATSAICERNSSDPSGHRSARAAS